MEERTWSTSRLEPFVGELHDAWQQRIRFRLHPHSLVEGDRPVVGVRSVEVGARRSLAVIWAGRNPGPRAIEGRAAPSSEKLTSDREALLSDVRCDAWLFMSVSRLLGKPGAACGLQ